MNRRELFVSCAKGALATAFGWAGLKSHTASAEAPPAAPASASVAGRATPAAGGGEIFGRPGSPSATRTIPGNVLPAPDLPFGGEINLNALQSKTWWPPRIVPPKTAPNILLIMTDDVGFGAPSTFGGVIPTPTLDRLAANGLRYTNFHTTSLCSPTRAALLTGRNHHSTGFGVISELATGFPGYDSVMGRESATIAKILKENGYRTAWFGKNHNTPAFETSQAGERGHVV